MKTKIFALTLSAVLALGALAGCGNETGATQTQEPSATTQEQAAPNKEQAAQSKDQAVQSKYITVKDFKEEIKDKDDSPLILDVRKAADHQKDGIEGSIGADMDAAKGGDLESGKANMTKALEEAGLMKDGQFVNKDKDIVLVCYSGKSYAEAATKVLNEMGYNMDEVETLEGGMKAYSADK